MKPFGGRSDVDAGFAAVELVAGVALLLVPVATIALTLPVWSERQTAARAIAREVARRAAGEGVCDAAAASELAATMASNLGIPHASTRVALGCAAGRVLAPGSPLEVAVTVAMPALHLVGMGEVGEWTWTARHRQPVDAYVGLP
jgi:hypothetical protein